MRFPLRRVLFLKQSRFFCSLIHLFIMVAIPFPSLTTELDKWFDSLELDRQELYNYIQEFTSIFDDATSPSDCDTFMNELSDYGITTCDDFESAYYWETDSFSYEADFVEYIVTELSEVELPPYLVIDYQASWDRNYRNDFFTITFGATTMFFSNNF